jgi:hypothetical protein
MEFHRGQPATPNRKLLHVIPFETGRHYACLFDPHVPHRITVFLHYDSTIDRRVPCIGKECKCRGSGIGWARECRIYVPCFFSQCGMVAGRPMQSGNSLLKYGIVGITENCANDVLYEGKNEVWWMRRRGKKRNGPIDADPLPWDRPQVKWPENPPVLDTIARMFGVQAAADERR